MDLSAVNYKTMLSYLLRSAHGDWQEWYDREHVLERVEQLGQGQDGDGERRVVPALNHQLPLQQDQREHL